LTRESFAYSFHIGEFHPRRRFGRTPAIIAVEEESHIGHEFSLKWKWLILPVSWSTLPSQPLTLPADDACWVLKFFGSLPITRKQGNRKTETLLS
jgi:hypothetical protein